MLAENLTRFPSKVYLRRRNAIEIHLGSSHGKDENMKNALKYFYHPGVQTESRNIRKKDSRISETIVLFM